MDKRAGASLGLTLLAVLVLSDQAGQDLISRGRGNNGHVKTAQLYWELGRTILFYLNIQDEISGFFQVVWAPSFRHVWEKPQDCTLLMQNKAAATPEPLEVLLLPWSALLFLPQHPDGSYDTAGVWHSPSSTWCRLLMSSRAEREERGRHWFYLLTESRLCCPQHGKVWDNPNHTPTRAAGETEGWGQGETAANPAVSSWVGAGEEVWGVSASGSQELTWNTKQDLPDLDLEGFQSHLEEEEEGHPSPVSCWLIRADKCQPCCCNEEGHLGALSSHSWHFPGYFTWQATGSLCFCRANINTD